MLTITLEVSESVMQRANQVAQILNRPWQEILGLTLDSALPEVHNVPLDMQAELMQMTWLPNQTLWQIAQSQLTLPDQKALEQLTLTQSARELEPSEKGRLEYLLHEYGRTTLRKARAYALLSLRSGQALLAHQP